MLSDTETDASSDLLSLIEALADWDSLKETEADSEADLLLLPDSCSDREREEADSDCFFDSDSLDEER